MSVTFNFNVPAIMGNIEAANDFAIETTSEMVLTDSNKLCPLRDGDLIDSSLNNSDLKNGIIVWEGPDALYLYYGVLMVGKNGSAWAKHGEKKKVKVPEQKLIYTTDRHPNAQAMWFHKAKDINCDQWIKEYKKAFAKAQKGRRLNARTG